MIVYAFNHVQLLLLVMLRVMMFILASPLFSMRVFPNWGKIGFAAFVALLIVPSIHMQNVPSAMLDTGSYILLAVKEMMIGLLLGWVASALYAVVSVAGRIMDLEAGFSSVSLLDPTTNQQVSVMGAFQGVLFALYFLGMNGLDGLVLMLLNSYKFVPLGHFIMPNNSIEFFTYIINMIFAIALQMVIPFVCVLLFTDVTLAVVSRTMPQLNVFVVGLPAKLFLGLLIFGVTMAGTTYLFGDLFRTLFEQTSLFLHWFGGA